MLFETLKEILLFILRTYLREKLVTILEQLFDAMFEKQETSRLVENVIASIADLLLELLKEMPYSSLFGEKHRKWFENITIDIFEALLVDVVTDTIYTATMGKIHRQIIKIAVRNFIGFLFRTLVGDA